VNFQQYFFRRIAIFKLLFKPENVINFLQNLKEFKMSAISYYFGCDHASLLKRLEPKAQSFDSTEIPLLRDLNIRIHALSFSSSQSDTLLKEATTQIWPVLRELCLLIQQIVFWCLGITALTDSIESKKQAIEQALTQADQESVLKVFSFAQTYDQGEYIPFTVEYFEHRALNDAEDLEELIIQEQFLIRVEGKEVMTFQQMSLSQDSKTLFVNIQDDHYIPELIQIAIELVQREKDILRLEISAPTIYHQKLEELEFQAEHRPDLERTLSGKAKNTPEKYKNIQATLDALKNQFPEKQEVAEPLEKEANESRASGYTTPPPPKEPRIWWLDKSKSEKASQSILDVEPTHPLIYKDLPPLSRLKILVPV